MKFSRMWIGLVGLVPLTGCFGTFHTATPIEEGTVELFAAPGLYLGVTPDEFNAVPNLEFGARFGLSDSMDIGAQGHIFGGQVDLNLAIINDPTFAFSVNPLISVIRIPGIFDSDPVFAGVTSIGLLADVFKDDRVTITLGLKPTLIFPFENDNLVLTVSGVALAKFRIFKHLAIAPGFEVMTPAASLADGVILRANLALLF